MKKTLAGVLGLFLVVGFFAGQGYATLTDWSTEEMWGYNIWHIFAIVGGSWLIYYGLRTKKKVQNT
jgi:hypothetical protein